jgi:hypothetical protein
MYVLAILAFSDRRKTGIIHSYRTNHSTFPPGAENTSSTLIVQHAADIAEPVSLTALSVSWPSLQGSNQFLSLVDSEFARKRHTIR